MAIPKDILYDEQEFLEFFAGHEEKISLLIEKGILRPFVGGSNSKRWFSSEMKEVISTIIQKEIPNEELEDIVLVDDVSQNPIISRESLRNYLKGKARRVSTETPKFGVQEINAQDIDVSDIDIDGTTVSAEEPVTVEENVTSTETVVETTIFTPSNIIHYIMETPIETLLGLNEIEEELINEQMRELIIGETNYGKLSLEQLRRSAMFEEIKPNNFRRLSRKETFVYFLIQKGILSNNNNRLDILQDKANITNVLLNHNELSEETILGYVTKYNGVVDTDNVETTETLGNTENGFVEEDTLSATEILAKLTTLPEEILLGIWKDLPEEFKA